MNERELKGSEWKGKTQRQSNETIKRAKKKKRKMIQKERENVKK